MPPLLHRPPPQAKPRPNPKSVNRCTSICKHLLTSLLQERSGWLLKETMSLHLRPSITYSLDFQHCLQQTRLTAALPCGQRPPPPPRPVPRQADSAPGQEATPPPPNTPSPLHQDPSPPPPPPERGGAQSECSYTMDAPSPPPYDDVRAVTCVLLVETASVTIQHMQFTRRRENLVKSRTRPEAPFAKGRKEIDTQNPPPPHRAQHGCCGECHVL